MELHSQGAGKNGKSDNGDEPAEEGNYKTKGNIICFDVLDLSIFHDEDGAKGCNSHDNDRPAKDEPLEKIGQRTSPPEWKMNPSFPPFGRGEWRDLGSIFSFNQK